MLSGKGIALGLSATAKDVVIIFSTAWQSGDPEVLKLAAAHEQREYQSVPAET
jgi:hypothetical protein